LGGVEGRYEILVMSIERKDIRWRRRRKTQDGTLWEGFRMGVFKKATRIIDFKQKTKDFRNKYGDLK